jgi:hypothetical protein
VAWRVITDEPVRRYLAHALHGGAERATGVRLTMAGRIKVGVWLPFRASQETDGRSFAWQARVGLGWASLLPGRGVTWRVESDDVVPSSIRVGWWFGSPRYAPFFEAEVTELWLVGGGA